MNHSGKELVLQPIMKLLIMVPLYLLLALSLISANHLHDFSYISNLEFREWPSNRPINPTELELNTYPSDLASRREFQASQEYLMSFFCHDQHFHIKLLPNLDFIHEHAKVTIEYGNGQRTTESLRDKLDHVYHGILYEDDELSHEIGWASILFYDGNNRITGYPTLMFEGSVMGRNSESFSLTTRDNFHSVREALNHEIPHISISDGEQVSEIVMSRKSASRFDKRDEISAKWKNDFSSATNLKNVPTCGNSLPQRNNRTIMHSHYQFEDEDSEMKSFSKRRDDGCPNDKKILYMGVAADCTYTAARGGTDSSINQILSVWNQVSSLYSSTFNVAIGVIDVFVMADCGTKGGTINWNQDCSDAYTINNRLSDFSSWRGTRNEDAGLWHLLTACSTLPVVGLSWEGMLCMTTTSPNKDGQVVSGTGVSALIANGEFEVVAHEIGHSFGAIHDCPANCACTGASCTSCCPCSGFGSCSCNSQYLMNPTADAKSTAFSPCSISDICSNIAFSGGNCLKDPGSMPLFNGSICGNGIKEMSEQCDCGTPEECANDPCCLPNCTLKAGAICSYSDSNYPCCKNCQIVQKTANYICRNGSNECDPSEVCDGSSASCPADVKAPDGTTCAGTGTYCASGQCTNRNLQCQILGKRINSSSSCTGKGDSIFSGMDLSTSCQVMCKGKDGSCYPFQYYYLDGTDCEGGRCKNGECLSVGLLGWVKQNLIPVIIGCVGIALLLIIFCFCACDSFPLLGRRVKTPNITSNAVRFNSQTSSSRPPNNVQAPPPSYHIAGNIRPNGSRYPDRIPSYSVY